MTHENVTYRFSSISLINCSGTRRAQSLRQLNLKTIAKTSFLEKVCVVILYCLIHLSLRVTRTHMSMGAYYVEDHSYSLGLYPYIYYKCVFYLELFTFKNVIKNIFVSMKR